MQNYSLLKELGSIPKPILLKRGMMATIYDFLLAAEYILSHGNENVILCERGIRTFETYTRNTLDISAFPIIKQLHIPVSIFLVERYILTGAPFPYSREYTLPLTLDQIQEMHASTLVSFYPHTATHPPLAMCSPDRVRRELQSSRTFVESITGKPAPILAYPFGREGVHFTKITKTIAQKCGYDLAVATDVAFSSRAHPDRFALKRIVCVSESVDSFALRISGALRVMHRILGKPFEKEPSVPRSYYPILTADVV